MILAREKFMGDGQQMDMVLSNEEMEISVYKVELLWKNPDWVTQAKNKVSEGSPRLYEYLGERDSLPEHCHHVDSR